MSTYLERILFFLCGYPDLIFEVVKKVDNNRYRDSNNIGLVNSGPIA